MHKFLNCKTKLNHPYLKKCSVWIGIILMYLPFHANTLTLSTIETQSPANLIKTENCPREFYNVSLPTNGKLCQVFANELPASMVFFVPQAPAEVVEYYQTPDNQFSKVKEIKQRFVLQNQNDTVRLIVSKDGQGSQVDVLIIES